MSLPLAGLRVVDFSRLLPGPWCTQTLGDLGADVIKVEQPEVGDYSRHNPPTYAATGVYFASMNRNKRSITLDLNAAADRAVALDLIRAADVLVESYRPGVPQRLGIDYDTAAKLNPGLVYCSLDGFGNEGALAHTPAHDLSLQGLAGVLGRTAVPPAMPGFLAGDYAAAAYATIAVLAALMRRKSDGRGCHLDIAMYDSVIAMSPIMLSGALARLAGGSGQPELEVWGGNPRYNTYRTRDGKAVTVSMLERHTWRHFCEYLGRPDLVDEAEDWSARHSDHGTRASAYREAIAGFCGAHDRDELCARATRANLPILPIYAPDEVLQSTAAQARAVVGWLDDPQNGRIPYLRDPLERAGLSDPTRRPPPELGEHSDEIRSEIEHRTR